MNEKLKEKTKESLESVLPITVIVLLLSVTIVPMEIGTLSLFLCGAAMLIVGMGLFQLGAETAMTPFGQGVGSWIGENKKLLLTIVICFLVGTFITISEPDLQVLAEQVASIPNQVLIWSVAVGVGIFIVIGVLRVIIRINLAIMLTICYIILFALSFFAPQDFVAVAFDSGGVTTGPMTVPFIMAIGVGLSAGRSDKDGASDSFGLVAMSSVGPILMVLLLSIFYAPSEAVYDATELMPVATTQDVAFYFLSSLPEYAYEVMVSMAPVIATFVIFQASTRRYRKKQVIKIVIGLVYTLVGLILFLTGVNVGFAPVGSILGESLAGSAFKWALIPIGAVIGYYIVKAEPAVKVLNDQVEEITGGTISHSMMNICLSLGVACAVGIAMLRAVTGIDIYLIIIPGYLLSLVLSHFVPSIFVGVAFDSGGVASGPMTSTFLLPLSMGACTAVGGNVVTDAFGVVALVAMTPLIAIQLMGVIYARKARTAEESIGVEVTEALNDDIIVEEAEDTEEDGHER